MTMRTNGIFVSIKFLNIADLKFFIPDPDINTIIPRNKSEDYPEKLPVKEKTIDEDKTFPFLPSELPHRLFVSLAADSKQI